MLAAVLLLLCVPLQAGCGGGPDAEVKQLLEEVNAHLEQVAKDLGGIEEVKQRWEELAGADEFTQETIAQAMALLEQGQSTVTSALKNLSEAVGALQEVKGLEISREMSSYVDMKLGALAEQKKSLELQLRAMVLRTQAFAEPESENLFDKLLDYRQQIDELEQRAIESAEQARKAHLDANDYYDEKIGN
jgi:uncharacterized phage infection (PIP) family protein YhgE